MLAVAFEPEEPKPLTIVSIRYPRTVWAAKKDLPGPDQRSGYLGRPEPKDIGCISGSAIFSSRSRPDSPNESMLPTLKLGIKQSVHVLYCHARLLLPPIRSRAR